MFNILQFLSAGRYLISDKSILFRSLMIVFVTIGARKPGKTDARKTAIIRNQMMIEMADRIAVGCKFRTHVDPLNWQASRLCIYSLIAAVG